MIDKVQPDKIGDYLERATKKEKCDRGYMGNLVVLHLSKGADMWSVMKWWGYNI